MLCRMSEPTDANDNRRARSLIETGADLAGAVGGAGASLIVGPLAGAAVGVAITRATRALSGLAEREQERVGATLSLIEQDAEKRHARGETPREDGFFDDRGGLRPEAVDLLEGVLRQAAAAYEERKVALLARLFTEVAHDDSVAPSQALFLVRLAGDLTYRQFVILSAYAANQVHPAHPAPDPDLDDLGERHLIGIRNLNGSVRPPGRMHAEMTIDALEGTPISASATVRSSLALTPLGNTLVRLTGATETVPQDDRNEWLSTLRTT